MEYAENVYRVAKITKTPNRYTIEMSVKGIEYSQIGEIYAKKIEKTSLTDKDTGRIQHTLHIWDESGIYMLLVFDIVYYPDGLFRLDTIEDYPTGKIERYVLA